VTYASIFCISTAWIAYTINLFYGFSLTYVTITLMAATLTSLFTFPPLAIAVLACVFGVFYVLFDAQSKKMIINDYEQHLRNEDAALISQKSESEGAFSSTSDHAKIMNLTGFDRSKRGSLSFVDNEETDKSAAKTPPATTDSFSASNTDKIVIKGMCKSPHVEHSRTFCPGFMR
jgi:hypothetical protein